MQQQLRCVRSAGFSLFVARTGLRNLSDGLKPGLQTRRGWLPSLEANRMCVAGGTGELHGLIERGTDFGHRMSIGAEGDRNVMLPHQPHKRRAGVNLFAFLTQTGGVEFDGDG